MKNAPTYTRAVLTVVLTSMLITLGACATVRPEQRSILADPVMQFEADSPKEAQLQHVLENREGSIGGGSVKGGGCGCN
ncbi:MAG: DUF4266 domain-containing protein [Myxococcales bacterium]|nr:DUF4266 domain-containing protein [Myxococcales bacterium]